MHTHVDTAVTRQSPPFSGALMATHACTCQHAEEHLHMWIVHEYPSPKTQTRVPVDKPKCPQLHVEDHVSHTSVSLCACAHARSHVSRGGLQYRSEVMALAIGSHCLLSQSKMVQVSAHNELHHLPLELHSWGKAPGPTATHQVRNLGRVLKLSSPQSLCLCDDVKASPHGVVRAKIKCLGQDVATS